MASTVVTRRRDFWMWPGPGRIYEGLLVAAVYVPLLYFFRNSGFAMAFITALTICFTYIRAVMQTDISAEDWKRFNRSVWVIRVCALATGYWLFSTTQARVARYGVVLAYAVLYAVCESAAWRRKRAIETAARLHN